MDSDVRNIWIAIICIMAFGLLTLFSATSQNVRVSQSVFYGQLIGAFLSLLIMFFLSRANYRVFYDISYLIYGASLLLLLVVMIFGRTALGATRWFTLAGISFQPSEVSKFAGILFLARYFSTRHPRLSFSTRNTISALWQDLIFPLLMTLLSCLLIFKQPDLGTAILIFGIFLGMLYASGIGQRVFWSLIVLCCTAVPLGWHFLKSYQKDRLLVFLNPNIDPLGAGYTIIQSKIAIGSGQFLGKGWLAGTQNQLNFLPERHTDFIFSVIGEEWGFLGSIFLLACYFVVMYSGFKIAIRVNDRFGSLMAIGILTILALQVVINMSMTMGLSPVVGITLPFVSYGRTSFIVFALMVGVLLNLGHRRSI